MWKTVMDWRRELEAESGERRNDAYTKLLAVLRDVEETARSVHEGSPGGSMPNVLAGMAASVDVALQLINPARSTRGQLRGGPRRNQALGKLGERLRGLREGLNETREVAELFEAGGLDGYINAVRPPLDGPQL
jgi:hypothetical protein